MIEVIRPGLLTTIQDTGRFGYQQYGMVVSGAVDSFALKVANILVGNPPNEAGLEITMQGPVLKAHQEMRISITGANLCPYLQEKSISMWATYLWEKGKVLDFRGIKEGMRSYLAVAGGFALNKVMGSLSTYLPSKLGGLEGRALKKGDFLPIHKGKERKWNCRLTPSHIPVYPQQKNIRVIPGPHEHKFTQRGLEIFSNTQYTVTTQMNRMGMRLVGDEKIEHHGHADIPSQAVTFGTIQVPSSGEPLIMLADCQITGGYAQIATVISADHALLAQSKPGDKVTFEKISVEQATKLYIEQLNLLKQLQYA